LAGHPQKGRGREGEPGGPPATDPRHRPREPADVESAIRGEREDRHPRQGPRDRAVHAERVAQPPEEHQEEHRAEEPAPAERRARPVEPRDHTPGRCDGPTKQRRAVNAANAWKPSSADTRYSHSSGRSGEAWTSVASSTSATSGSAAR